MRASTMQRARVGRRSESGEPAVWPDLYDSLQRGDATLLDIIWEQHRYHERRRWSAEEMLAAIDLSALSADDHFFIANAGRAELTAQPGAERVTRLADRECRRWLGKKEPLARAMQACATWSRYWNEEEAHHETVFNFLAATLSLEPPDDDTIIEFRKGFPDDDMLRTLTLLTCTEINATVTYNEYARRTREPGLKALLLKVGADEGQHMRYFISFAKALVDSGEFQAKEVLAIAHLFVRPGGEIYGATRAETAERPTHVNWWDQIDESEGGVDLLMGIEKKLQMTYRMIKRITGISVSSPEEIEDRWMDLVA